MEEITQKLQEAELPKRPGDAGRRFRIGIRDRSSAVCSGRVELPDRPALRAVQGEPAALPTLNLAPPVLPSRKTGGRSRLTSRWWLWSRSPNRLAARCSPPGSNRPRVVPPGIGRIDARITSSARSTVEQRRSARIHQDAAGRGTSGRAGSQVAVVDWRARIGTQTNDRSSRWRPPTVVPTGADRVLR